MSKEIFFDKPLDFENNQVWLSEFKIQSGGSGGEYDKWVELRNATKVDDITLEIKIPLNVTGSHEF